LWSFLTAFVVAMDGAALYFFEAGGTVSFIEPLTGIVHKYSKLLAICVAVLAAGCGAFGIGLMTQRAR
jgi:hypothetical protein